MVVEPRSGPESLLGDTQRPQADADALDVAAFSCFQPPTQVVSVDGYDSSWTMFDWLVRPPPVIARSSATEER